MAKRKNDVNVDNTAEERVMEEKKNLKRPGGELARRPLNFFWVVDCSGSMYGEKMGTVNCAIQQTIPEMRDAASSNPNAEVLIRTLQFSSGASWMTDSPVKVENFVWEDLEANGVTDLGRAFDLLAAQLSMDQIGDRALPPVMVLLSDGQPTDDYKKGLTKLMSQPWAKKSVRIAISIGQDADDKVLEEFTGNRELVLQANNATSLTKMIKWASTAVSLVSAPPSRVADTEENGSVTPAPLVGPSDGAAVFDINDIPDPSAAGQGVW